MPGIQRVLVVDDDSEVRNVLQLWLEGRGWEVATAETGFAGLEMLLTDDFTLAVLDLNLPGCGGMVVLKRLKSCGRRTPPVIVITGFGDVEKATQAMKLGAVDFLTKPVKYAAFFGAVDAVVQRIVSAAVNAKANGAAPAKPNVLAERIDAFLKDNLADRELCPELVGERFTISGTHASRTLKARYDEAFQSRLRRHRITAAKALLLKTDMQIDEVAQECGFSDRRRLSEALRDSEDLTPTQFRQLYGSWLRGEGGRKAN